MSKYRFIYQDSDANEILTYETDLEPPRAGDYVQLHTIMKDDDVPNYQVREIFYNPQNVLQVDIYIVLDSVQLE